MITWIAKAGVFIREIGGPRYFDEGCNGGCSEGVLELESEKNGRRGSAEPEAQKIPTLIFYCTDWFIHPGFLLAALAKSLW